MWTHRPRRRAGGVMISRAGYGWARLLVLAASFGLSSISVNAQAVPSTEEADFPAMETEAAADPDEADIKDLELDWTQLNVDASTLTTSPVSKARLAPRA